MIDALLAHIKDHLLDKNPLTFQNGYSGARQYQDGKVVIYDNYEGIFVGLTDANANYFYIRYLDQIELDIVDEANRTTACKELSGSGSFRLVAWVKNGDLGRLQEVLLTDLMEVDFSTLSATDKQRFSNIKMVTPSNLQSDFEQLYKEETLSEDEDVHMTDNITLTSIDFGLLFNYKSNEACLNRQVCT